jgi:hypothetical protein
VTELQGTNKVLQENNTKLQTENQSLHQKVSSLDQRLKEINLENKRRMDDMKHDMAQERLAHEERIAKQMQAMQQQMQIMMNHYPAQNPGSPFRKRLDSKETPAKEPYEQHGMTGMQMWPPGGYAMNHSMMQQQQLMPPLYYGNPMNPHLPPLPHSPQHPPPPNWNHNGQENHPTQVNTYDSSSSQNQPTC